MQTYSDPILRSKAYDIKLQIDKLAEALTYMQSSFTGEEITLTNPASTEMLLQKITTNGLFVAKEKINEVLPNLEYLKNNSGSNDNIYLEYSEAFALVISAVISIPVGFANGLSMASDFRKDKSAMNRVSQDLAEATMLFGILSRMDLSQHARNEINRNTSIISTVEKRINSKTGCYIATCVYGCYNAVEVVQLRSYRDNVLAKNTIGKLIINIYYHVSPIIVSRIGENKIFKIIFRMILERVINSLK